MNKKLSLKDQQLLALWAADCAEHVLPIFEEKFPDDKGPRMAIEAAREWARTGVFKMADIRGASLLAHAAAREADEDSAPRFAARAAGHAVATAHVAQHSLGSAWYARKAAKAAGVTGEKEWQESRIPPSLKKWIRTMYSKKYE